jgi:hypothetical protein
VPGHFTFQAFSFEQHIRTHLIVRYTWSGICPCSSNSRFKEAAFGLKFRIDLWGGMVH